MTLLKIVAMCFILSFFTKSSAQMAPTKPLFDIAINDIDGQPIQLSDYKGKKILFVNVASECGFTGQYEGLQKLYDTYKDKLMIIGVPCNQFGGQEPGSSETIKSFCQKNYGVTFLITEKVDVKGSNQHPLYAWLTQKSLNGNQDTSVKWNFQKYLVDEKGNYVDYYLSATTPLSSKITNHLK
ncbi:Hydroperoxy fatty acid reductase gpx1 [Mariniflexile rhizosphaerae]|nr:Hydroperoxy fatty acid reductase gpx1 [Mariniflexile sp. TRM1-10]